MQNPALRIPNGGVRCKSWQNEHLGALPGAEASVETPGSLWTAQETPKKGASACFEELDPYILTGRSHFSAACKQEDEGYQHVEGHCNQGRQGSQAGRLGPLDCLRYRPGQAQGLGLQVSRGPWGSRGFPKGPRVPKTKMGPKGSEGSCGRKKQSLQFSGAKLLVFWGKAFGFWGKASGFFSEAKAFVSGAKLLASRSVAQL